MPSFLLIVYTQSGTCKNRRWTATAWTSIPDTLFCHEDYRNTAEVSLKYVGVVRWLKEQRLLGFQLCARHRARCFSIHYFTYNIYMAATMSWILQMRNSGKLAELPEVVLPVMDRAVTIIHISYFKPSALSITCSILRSLEVPLPVRKQTGRREDTGSSPSLSSGPDT